MKPSMNKQLLKNAKKVNSNPTMLATSKKTATQKNRAFLSNKNYEAIRIYFSKLLKKKKNL